ncbi:hypothetical protein BpHYR1_041601, partial [Brachionus plicatilis]
MKKPFFSLNSSKNDHLSRFQTLPPFLLIETRHNFTVSLEKVPKTLEIESQTYRFLCSSRNHFK